MISISVPPYFDASKVGVGSGDGDGVNVGADRVWQAIKAENTAMKRNSRSFMLNNLSQDDFDLIMILQLLCWDEVS